MLDALSDCCPDVPFVFPECLFGLRLREGSDGVLLGLVTHVGGQGHHRVHHVVPVLAQPGDRVDIAAVVEGHLDVLSSVAGLFGVLMKIYLI